MRRLPPPPVRTAILASGNGSNFEALVEAERRGALQPASVVALLCDRPGAPVLERAARLGVEAIVLDRKAFANRDAFDAALVDALRARGVELVALAGFMRLLGRGFLAAFPGRVVNVHPSLLPAFPGLRAIEQALAAGAATTGATVHFVDEGIDTGPIIAQEAVAIEPGDDAASLAERVHAVEHRLFPEALRLVAAGNAFLKDGETWRSMF